MTRKSPWTLIAKWAVFGVRSVNLPLWFIHNYFISVHSFHFPNLYLDAAKSLLIVNPIPRCYISAAVRIHALIVGICKCVVEYHSIGCLDCPCGTDGGGHDTSPSSSSISISNSSPFSTSALSSMAHESFTSFSLASSMLSASTVTNALPE